MVDMLMHRLVRSRMVYFGNAYRAGPPGLVLLIRDHSRTVSIPTLPVGRTCDVLDPNPV